MPPDPQSPRLPSSRNRLTMWLSHALLAGIGLCVGVGIGAEYTARRGASQKLESGPWYPAPPPSAGQAITAEDDSGANLRSQPTPSQAAPSAPAAPRTASLPADEQRCTAMTKQGTRCKRKAQAGRDRCWQH